MLKLLNITKEYRIDDNDVTLALNNVSIEFRQNEFVSILGPSGCGKTTLLNIVGGLDRYTSGDIQVDGVSTKEFDDVDWDTYRNQRIGFVFQQPYPSYEHSKECCSLSYPCRCVKRRAY